MTGLTVPRAPQPELVSARELQLSRWENEGGRIQSVPGAGQGEELRPRSRPLSE